MSIYLSKYRGYTLIEILLVVFISAILVTMIILSFSAFFGAQDISHTIEEVIAALNTAQSKTLAYKDQSQYGVRFESDKAILFTGTTYPGSGDDYPYARGVTLKSVTLQGGGTDVVFNRLTGETGNYGTVILKSSRSGDERTINIYETGIIEVTNN